MPLRARLDGLAGRLVLATLLVLAITVGVAGTFVVRSQRLAITKQLDASGRSLARATATASSNLILSLDYPSLQHLAHELVGSDENVVEVRVERTDGTTLAVSGDATVRGGRGLRRFDEPVVLAGSDGRVVLGHVRLSMSEDTLGEATLQQLALIIVATILAFALLASVISVLIQRLLGRPLSELDQQVRRMGHDLTQPIVLHAGGELERFASMLEEQRVEVVRSRRELEMRNEHVEELSVQKDQMLAELSQALQDAKAASRAKTVFMANMSHEIRTPLNGILGFARLLAEDAELGRREAEWAQAISDSGDSLLGIVNDILDFSKLTGGHVELECMPFDLHELARRMVETFRATATRKGIAIEVRVASDVPRWVEGDPGRLRQVVLNLLGNALKFTKVGHVVLSIESGDGGAGAVRRLVFEVADTGIGLSAEACERIFDEFQQADGTTTRRYGGTGLGLTIARELVELMGGEIGVQSEPGVGSSFHFTIALGMTQVPAETAPSAARPSSVLESMRVLVVEDNPVNRRVARAFLERSGIDVLEAVDGLEAIELSASGAPDVILMDCHMPRCDGYEATRVIRERERACDAPRVPIIALTANALDGERARCLAGGMDDYVAKPIDPEALFAALGRACRSRDAA